MTETALDQYRAARTSAGLLELSHRGKVRVTGADHLTFLHSMISNDVAGLGLNQGRHGTLLTPTGKMVAYFLYYRFADHVLIDLEGPADPLVSALEKYIVMDDVHLEDISAGWKHYSIQGPRCGELIEEWFGQPMPDHELQAEPVRWHGRSGLLIRRSWLGHQGVDLLLSQSTENDREELLVSGEKFGLREIQPEAFQMLRLEAKVPEFGVDVDASNYPMEAGLEQAISLTKGCYVGQEVVSKATYIGGVARRLVLLALATAESPAAGAEVLSPEGRRIGRVTSVSFSPALEGALAFAIVKREYAAASTSVRVRLDQERAVQATVLDEKLEF